MSKHIEFPNVACVHILSGRLRPDGLEIEARFINQDEDGEADHERPVAILYDHAALQKIREFDEYWSERGFRPIPVAVTADWAEFEILAPKSPRFKPFARGLPAEDDPEPPAPEHLAEAHPQQERLEAGTPAREGFDEEGEEEGELEESFLPFGRPLAADVDLESSPFFDARLYQ
jgi:hypothetical protein